MSSKGNGIEPQCPLRPHFLHDMKKTKNSKREKRFTLFIATEWAIKSSFNSILIFFCEFQFIVF
jgi:hypothetical protein